MNEQKEILDRLEEIIDAIFILHDKSKNADANEKISIDKQIYQYYEESQEIEKRVTG